jgi:hypothetical protein
VTVIKKYSKGVGKARQATAYKPQDYIRDYIREITKQKRGRKPCHLFLPLSSRGCQPAAHTKPSKFDNVIEIKKRY